MATAIQSEVEVQEPILAAIDGMVSSTNLICACVYDAMGTYLVCGEILDDFMNYAANLSAYFGDQDQYSQAPDISHHQATLTLDLMKSLFIGRIAWLDDTAPFVCRQVENEIARVFVCCAQVRGALVRDLKFSVPK